MTTCVHLPVAHTEQDIQLAGALAHVLRSEELYVAWSTDGGPARPLIDAHLEVESLVPDVVRVRQASLWHRLLEYWRGL